MAFRHVHFHLLTAAIKGGWASPLLSASKYDSSWGHSHQSDSPLSFPASAITRIAMGGSSRFATHGFSAPLFISDRTSGLGDRISIRAGNTSSFLSIWTLWHCRVCWCPILPTSLSSPPVVGTAPFECYPHLPILCQYLPLPSSLSHSFPLLSIIISILGLQPKTEKKA